MHQTVDNREGMVEPQELVEYARKGDRAAFTALAQRYQEMALGYALAILGDFHLAQDVTQEALLAAYRGLRSLEDTTRFPAWLRGIVRFQCGRARRSRLLDQTSLEDTWEMPAATPGPEQLLDMKEGFHRVLAAIRSLPEPQREVAMLFFIKDYSHREIASFLGLPATTVNNRLHAARKALRVRLVMNEKQGRVSAVHGAIMDVEFAPEDTPVILSGLRVGDHGGESLAPTLQVVSRVKDGLVRCVARGDLTGIVLGAKVVHVGEPLLEPLNADMVTRILPILGAFRRPTKRQSLLPGGVEPPVMLETGIKVIDLLCPLTWGGMIGIFGPAGTGRMVISAEVLRNVAREGSGLTILAFLNGESEGRALYDAPDEAPHTTGTDQIIFLPIENSIDTAAPALLAASPLLDARLFLSFTLAKNGIWPAIDPLLSISRLMDPAIIGNEHYNAAKSVRELLRRERDLLEGGPEGTPRDLTTEDLRLIARARR
ncbi:MAG TPA: sigma-70 family RNA polymerase sigma factor, partial [Chloroflexota bacterium]|nr:sigma-70 family RNA polymerase sigma factor [Chloroflexota bacterium]